MFYEAEMNFLQNVLQKYRLQVLKVCPDEMPDRRLDYGLRESLGMTEEYERSLQEIAQWARGNVIYKLTDAFRSTYLFLLLPDVLRTTALVVGPYLTAPLSDRQLMEHAERVGVHPWQFRQLERYYGSVPIIEDEGILFTLFSVFGERIWGSGEAYEIMDVNQELSSAYVPFSAAPEETRPEETLLNMQVMEARYAYENELMQTVSQGLVHRADLLMSRFSQMSVESRQADPIRNLKNYSIICNTLLRKAAESGGVHPVYLDSISSEFARKIESIHSVEEGQTLMGEMIRDYCRLVRKRSMKNYSLPVQRAVTHIDSDLSGDLRLRTLAAMQNMNASYLSTLFKKETGQTVTEHVNQKRVELAVRLLKTTRLQIQSIAQHCGFSDVNYFSKLFKKYIGVTPKEYRNMSGT